MIKEGMFVRCPIEKEHPGNPRDFATGKVVSINEFNETACIKFEDPFDNKKYFDFFPNEVAEAPLEALDHCSLIKGSLVKVGKREGIVVEYYVVDDLYEYYILFQDTKEYQRVSEKNISASFFSGSSDPVTQLKKYEFQNPCWYLGRQVVKDTMNILDNSIFGFKELAGCKIYLKAFQLNTIMQCLQGDTCRFMLADEVGLGKTIEACSVLKIYLKNKASKKILIAVPQALVSQWRTELLFKFGLYEGEMGSNELELVAIEELTKYHTNSYWDFVIVDEVHNCLHNDMYYEWIHSISVNSENIILLSATPIQQRMEEYLKLLRLILPKKYDELSIGEFADLVEKQNKITRYTHTLLDEMDSLKNEILPEVNGDPHDDDDVQDELSEILDEMVQISNLIGDPVLSQMIEKVDVSSEDCGMYSVQVFVSYVCDNYQLERNIIRGRRAVLGVYPKDPDGEFAERKLVEIPYSIDDDTAYYENEAYRTLSEWIINHQNAIGTEEVKKSLSPILEAFFSSSWAYCAELGRQKEIIDIPDNVLSAAKRWLEEENEITENLPDALDNIEAHASRLLLVVDYLETQLFGKKVVVFTDKKETFDKYYAVLTDAFGEEVKGFASHLDEDEAELNIYKFQSTDECKVLICDKSGGEGRNLQNADYIIHIDLPWNINTIEQRIGRLDRMGRDVEIPVTSVVVHSINSFEDQLFKFWNEGLNVFTQSLSGLEIIMNEINRKIVESLTADFEFGLYRVIPELIQEASGMREAVHKEQIFDTAALRFRPLYIQLEKLLTNYQMNENDMFADTMMSWARLAGFETVGTGAKDNLIAFAENRFNYGSAKNTFLLPPDWEEYMSKKENEMVIRVQRDAVEEKTRRTEARERIIKGTFDRDIAIKNDYIHFYAPGDEIFDCIVQNAMQSYKGKSCALATKSEIDWKGFVYTYSIEPNERLLLDNGVSLFALGMFRQYLATSMQVIPVGFTAYSEVPEKMVISEHKRLAQQGYIDGDYSIEHLGKRGKEGAFLSPGYRNHCSNLEWFKGQYGEEKWNGIVEKSSQLARKRALEKFKKESNLAGAKEMIAEILSMKESYVNYFGIKEDLNIEEIKRQYAIVFESLSKPIIRLESACYLWLVKIK